MRIPTIAIFALSVSRTLSAALRLLYKMDVHALAQYTRQTALRVTHRTGELDLFIVLGEFRVCWRALTRSSTLPEVGGRGEARHGGRGETRTMREPNTTLCSPLHTWLIAFRSNVSAKQTTTYSSRDSATPRNRMRLS